MAWCSGVFSHVSTADSLQEEDYIPLLLGKACLNMAVIDQGTSEGGYPSVGGYPQCRGIPPV